MDREPAREFGESRRLRRRTVHDDGCPSDRLDAFPGPGPLAPPHPVSSRPANPALCAKAVSLRRCGGGCPASHRTALVRSPEYRTSALEGPRRKARRRYGWRKPLYRWQPGPFLGMVTGMGRPAGTVRAPHEPTPALLAVSNSRLHPHNGRLFNPGPSGRKRHLCGHLESSLARRARRSRGYEAGTSAGGTPRCPRPSTSPVLGEALPRPCDRRDPSSFDCIRSATTAPAVGIGGRSRRRGSGIMWSATVHQRWDLRVAGASGVLGLLFCFF